MERKTVLFIVILICLMLLTCIKKSFGQNEKVQKITARVFDQSTNRPLPGANILLQSDPLVGTTSGENGSFILENSFHKGDSLIISFIGYREKVIAIDKIRESEIIYLNPKTQEIEQAVIKGERIIAEEFTIKQMKQLDIYLNPISKADPILAVNSMPASTTTDESANISLRGSSPAETGIYFNDVPVYDAVRFSQLNGIGTFSIFNTAIIERMHVFPSNPPLEYGNTSSGLISIQSQNTIPEHNQNNISLSLANIGGQMSRRINSKTGLNIFSNYQPSQGLIGVNEQAMDNLNSFYSGDLGIHAIHHFSDSLSVKLFNYSNVEGYGYDFIHPSFKGIFDQNKRRNFTILNMMKKTRSGEVTANTGISFSDENYNYGNTNIDIKQRDLYLNLNYHHFFGKFSIKSGLSYDSRNQDLDGTFPVYNYALGKDDPSIDYSQIRDVKLTEAFVYGKYEFDDNWVTGIGIRKNIPAKDQKDYLSAQWNVNYSFLKNHSLNLSLGRYHNYSLPNAEIQNKTLYQSDQVAVDYKLDLPNIEVTSALFAKNTKFSTTDEEITGAEIYAKMHLLGNKFTIQGSYTFINAERKNSNLAYPSKFDMDYFVRGSLKYQHSNNLDISLIMLYREGSFYQPVIGREYDDQLNLYAPEYMSKDNIERLPDYFKLDLSLSKLWPLSSDLSIITFFNVSNLLNTKNVRDKTYNFDYTETKNLFYSKRTIYFGGMIYF